MKKAIKIGAVIAIYLAIVFGGVTYFKWLGPDPASARANALQWANAWGAVGNLFLWGTALYWLCRGFLWLYKKGVSLWRRYRAYCDASYKESAT